MSDIDNLWPENFRLSDLPKSGKFVNLAADQPCRDQIAAFLGIVALNQLEAEIKLLPWLDGAEIKVYWRARLVQICGASLEAFETDLEEGFEIKVLPENHRSKWAVPSATPSVIEDFAADDPPDILSGDLIPLGSYIIEHVSLALDPYPKKPGVEFIAPEEAAPDNPFSVLKNLQL